MSRLFGLARTASEYIRNRFQKQYREADEVVTSRSGGTKGYAQRRRGLPDRLPEIFDRTKNPPVPPPPPGGSTGPNFPGAPPLPPPPGGQSGVPPIPPLPGEPQPPPETPPPSEPPQQPPKPPREPEQPPRKPPLGKPDEEAFDDIQLLGRDAGYDEDDFAAVMQGMRRTPGSTNVYGYYFEREARRTGILYVTFLQQNGQSAGPTYAYYDVTVKKALEFQKATASSAGGAVWDYLRVRGSVWAHQNQYRLIHVSGEYVPRKVTRDGFKNRAVPALGIGRRSFRRNTLPARKFVTRGGPNRGDPERGDPYRGEL